MAFVACTGTRTEAADAAGCWTAALGEPGGSSLLVGLQGFDAVRERPKVVRQLGECLSVEREVPQLARHGLQVGREHLPRGACVRRVV